MTNANRAWEQSSILSFLLRTYLKLTTTFLYIVLIVPLNSLANAPDFYSEPGFYPNREYSNPNEIDTVDTFSGTLSVQQADVFNQGNGGFNLLVRRVYTPPQNGLLTIGETGTQSTGSGIGWNINYGRVLGINSFSICPQVQPTETTENNPVFEREDGSQRILYRSNVTILGITTSDYITIDRWRAQCKTYTQPNGLDGAGQSFQGLVITSPDGVVYEMGARNTSTSTLYTTKIIHPSSNYIDIEYFNRPNNGGHLVKSVTPNLGDQVTFTYLDVATFDARISSISSGTLYTWAYEYNDISGLSGNQYQLTRVVRPDGSSWRYEYYDVNGTPSTNAAGRYALKKITAPWNGTIEYTYDRLCFTGDSQFNVCLPGQPLTTSVKTRTIGGQSITSGTWTYEFDFPVGTGTNAP